MSGQTNATATTTAPEPMQEGASSLPSEVAPDRMDETVPELQALAFGTLLQDTASLLVEVLGADLASVAEVDNGGTTLRQGFLVRGSTGELEALAADALPVSNGKPMAAHALEKSQIVATTDLAKETRFNDEALQELDVVSGFSVPLEMDNRPFAVLGAFSKTPREFTMADTLFAKAIGQQLATMVRRLRNEYLRRNRPDKAQPHDGPSEELRSSPRKAYPYIQKIAPMYSGLIPSPDKFFEVRCRDVSAGGVSVYLAQPPDFENLVIRLGTPPSLHHYSARIVRVELVEEDDQNLYLVGCRFTGRVYF